jgi:hypothetical protein
VWPLAVSDWIAGLAMRDYVDRRFGRDFAREWRMTQSAFAFIERHCATCLRRGALEVSVISSAPSAGLAVTIRGPLDPAFFTRTGYRLERLLRDTAITLNLRVEALAAGQREQFDRLLARLARYGDRVTIRINEPLRAVLAVDSSVFRVVLEGA